MSARALETVPGAAGVARLARGTALAAFGLIVLGAVVRSTGSGLACPDWPLCHGRLIPPLQTQVLLEWSHRFVALLVSLGTLALSGLVIVMDIRHPLREFDLKMLDYARSRALPAHCLLTKADKLSRGAQGNTLLGVRKELGEVASVQLFSSETKLGIDEARAVVSKWLQR